MKRVLKIFLFVACFMAVTCFNVSADAPKFNLDMGSDYLYFRNGDDLKEAAKITGSEERELKKLFDAENVVMLALSKDNLRQIRVAYYTNELSAEIGNLDLLDIKDLAEIKDSLSDKLSLGGENFSADYIENTEAPINKYIICTELFTDSGGDYSVTQYLTVKDGAFWHITTYAPNHSGVPYIIPYFSVEEDGFDTSKILYIIGAVFAVFAVVVFVLYFREKIAEESFKRGSSENV